MSPHQFDHCHCDGRSVHPKHDGPFADSFDDPSIETVYTYNKRWGPRGVSQAIGNASTTKLPLVKRQDRHEDGSVSTTYYLELTEDQYRRLGGK